MPSLKKFLQMAGLPGTIRRWSQAAAAVKEGQEALKLQAVRTGDIEIMDWHPQVHQEHARSNGLGPEDFQFEQWPVLDVRIEPSQTRHAPFWYVCDITPGTPLSNQYDGSGNKLADPVGMCLQAVEFKLYEADNGPELDEQDSLPTDGKVQGRPSNRSKLWNRLTPGTSIRVKLIAYPDFYYLNRQGGMVGYANTPDGQFKGRVVESPVYTLSMDESGEVSIS